ncbi:MAG TPA: OmpA family protein [Bryobacteraceae bacterium]|nr:OmpA family protein [Bryobacteraceae bacterium]
MSVSLLLTAGLGLARVEPTTHTFTAGQKAKVQGVIVSRDGDTVKLRSSDDSIGTVDLTQTTKIQLKKGFFKGKSTMDAASLLPGLQIEAQGKGNEKGELVADRVVFDPNSMRASRQIDTRVAPIEARTGSLEGRAGNLEGRATTLESRAGQMENRQGQLEDQEKQTQQQVTQVKTEADQANQGVVDVNGRVSNLDNYTQTDKKTVYFKYGSSALTDESKQTLDQLAQETQNDKAYIIEVAGFADPTGKASRNQTLSEQRAQAVITYLEQSGNVPIRRILTPAGMGTTHQVNDNRTAQDRQQNRRVDVTIYVNQGVVASNNAAPHTPGDQIK